MIERSECKIFDNWQNTHGPVAQAAMKLRANNIDIEVEDAASINPDLQCRPVVLLIMGLGMQLTAWPALWVQELVDAG